MRSTSVPHAKVMTNSLSLWACLHTVNATAVRERWRNNPEQDVKEDLLIGDRFDPNTKVWTIKSELELVRLLGALQWMNPRLKLWYRGEKQFFPSAVPRRIRLPWKETFVTQQGVEWLNLHAWQDRALRDRSPLARAAILQHYGCPTSLLDITASYEAACAFAFAADGTEQSHIRVFALPRHQHAVTVFDDADVVLVDLHAELPSYCMRPHVQQAAFVARRRAIYNDIEGEMPVEREDALVDALCIAHLRLQFDDGYSRFYKPRIEGNTLYPKRSKSCKYCEDNVSDMNGDFLLHFLECLVEEHHEGVPEGFPDSLSEA